MTATPFKHWSKARTVVTVGLVVVFFGLDLLLGLLFNQRIVGSRNLYYHHDIPPNYSGHKQWGEVVYPFFSNSLGFADHAVREIPLTSSGQRILLMGDSFTEGVGQSFGDTFAGILGARLESHGMEILNAGVIHYSPKLYYLKTKYLLEKVGLKIDKIIVFIDISDIQDEIFFEMFEPYDGMIQPEDSLLQKSKAFLRRYSLSYFALQKIVSNLRPDHTLVGSAGSSTDLYLKWQDRLQMEAVNWREVTADSPLYTEEFMQNYQTEKDNWTLSSDIFKRWGARGLALAAEHMDRLHQLCNRYDVSLTVVVYPWPQQIFERDVDSLQQRYWKDFCAKRGIDFIDLFPLFINDSPAVEIYESYFILNDVHWNGSGHRLVADALYRQLTQ